MVGPAEEIPPGSSKLVDVDGVAVAVFNVDGEFFAIADRCPHKGNSLSCGELDGRRIVCPGHGWDFDLATGETSWDHLLHKTWRVVVEEGVVALEV